MQAAALARGATAVVCCARAARRDPRFQVPPDVTVLEVNAEDDLYYQILEKHLDQVTEFLREHQGQTVFVHCMQGINRSAALCAGSMLEEGMALSDVVTRLVEKRGAVLRNTAFLMQLIKLAEARDLLS